MTLDLRPNAVPQQSGRAAGVLLSGAAAAAAALGWNAARNLLDARQTRRWRRLTGGRLTEHAQSEHGRNLRVFVRARDKRGGAEGGDGIQLFSIIQNATSKVEVVQRSTTAWRRKSGLEPRGIWLHDFYQFNY